MSLVDVKRRVALAALLLGVSLAWPARAQDPRVTEAQQVARAWLVIADGQDAPASYKAAGPKFQGAMTEEQWADALKKFRTPLGEVVQRTLMAGEASNKFPGQPDGDFVLLSFRSAFASKTVAMETVTVERGTDGVWKVVGYSIR